MKQNLLAVCNVQFHGCAYCVAAIYCPKLIPPIHGSLSSSLVIFGSVVNAVCDVGYKLSNGSLQKTLECLDTVEWNDTVENCIGIATIITLRPLSVFTEVR